MKRLAVFAALFFCASFFAARPAVATVAVALGGPELAAISDVIVHAHVVTLGGHVTTKPLRVYTDVELEVIDGLKGANPGDHLKVSFPGGVAARLGMFVSGQVAFEPNGECVIYLARQANGNLIPAAMKQGYFKVTRRAYDGVRMGYKNTSGLTLLEGRGQLQRLNDSPQELLRPLVQVLGDIRTDIQKSANIDPHFLESKTARAMRGD